jgi:hypothetical protein
MVATLGLLHAARAAEGTDIVSLEVLPHHLCSGGYRVYWQQCISKYLWLFSIRSVVGNFKDGTGHLDAGFCRFSSVFEQVLSWFQSSSLLLRASHAVLLIYIRQN